MPFHDLKISVRNLLKSPGFTLTAVLMLAFGIGATTAIFSVVEGVILRPLPFPDPERLVRLNDILQGADVGGTGEAGVTGPDIRNYMRDTHSFESLGGIRTTGYELAGIGEEHGRLRNERRHRVQKRSTRRRPWLRCPTLMPDFPQRGAPALRI